MGSGFDYDVIVLGGGSAGVSAAICAAKTGANTLLIEKNGMLGGTATVGRVNFPGLFHAWGQQIIAGPCYSVLEKCRDAGGADFPSFEYCPKHHSMNQISVDVFTYIYQLEKNCIESGITLLYHAMPFAVQETANGVTISVTEKGSFKNFTTRTLIDASGDADGLRLAGYEMMRSENIQPCTLINDLGGYSFDCLENRQRFDKWCDAAYRDGTLLLSDTQGQSLWEQLRNRRISMHIDADFNGLSVETSEGKTSLEIRSREILWRLLTKLRTYPGLEHIYVTHLGSECGVRESVRIIGNTVMTVDKYVSGYMYPDAVCYVFYPVDRHIANGIVQVYHKEGIIPTVPRGALIPKGSQYMAVAGRCISADTDTQSAARVQAACMATGQAVGVNCALAARKGCQVSEISVQEVKDGLLSLGAVIP